MENKTDNVIFIFTKDRYNSLDEVLKRIDSKYYSICVIDDSSDIVNITNNKKIVTSIKRGIYLGVDEHENFYEKLNVVSEKKISIGNSNWNLGHSRNFALDYSKKNNFIKVLFMDDDILVDSIADITKGFEIVNENNFIGYQIVGMVDDSIIGHISSEVNFKDTDFRLLSGGFMFFNPQTIVYNFLNIYNEDWILQLLEKKKEIILYPINVYHKPFDPYKNYKEKILFQEYGEIMVTGLLKLYSQSTSLGYSKLFWQNIIEERRNIINDIERKAILHLRNDLIEMLEWLKINYNQYSPEYFHNLIKSIKM